MTVSYKICDICGNKISDGCVMDVRYRAIVDGKNVRSQSHVDICNYCWGAIKEAAESAQAEGAKA